MTQQRPVTKKPWYKRWWAIALLVVFVLGTIGNLLDGDEAEPAATQLPTVTTPAVPSPSPSPSPVESTTEPEPTTEAPEPEPEPDPTTGPGIDETTGGLDLTTARMECAQAAEQAIQREAPGVEVAVDEFFGVLAEEYRPDSDDIFIKMTATAGGVDLNVECYMSGTSDKPSVDEVLWY